MIKFLVDSDLHFRRNIRNDKLDHVKKITNLCNQEKINALICPGDLTNNGWNGKHILCWYYGGKEDQLTPLKKQYVDILSQKLPVYLCGGNHDYYVPWPYITHPVINYIKERHGAKYYSFDIQTLHFICLDRYPDKYGIKFLQKDLEKYKDRDIIIIFHYNLIGPYSNWWKENEKEIFYNTIKNHNIIALIVGHWHTSRVDEWKGYKVIYGAGSKIAKCTYDVYEKNLDVSFI